MSLKITDWAVEDRPREKMIRKGISTLSDAELLAILISSGTRKKSAVDLGRELLSSVSNNLNSLGKLSISDLLKFRGIGPARAVTISVHELQTNPEDLLSVTVSAKPTCLQAAP